MSVRSGTVTRWQAGLLAGYTVASLAAELMLARTAPLLSHPSSWPASAAMSAAVTATACLMLLRLPRHAVTRILTVMAVAGPTGGWLGMLAEHLSGVPHAVVERLVNVAWVGTIPLLAMLILLFPTGQPPGPRWVPALRIQQLMLGVIVVCALVGHEYLLVRVVAVTCGLVLLATAGAAVISLVLRWRRAAGSEQAGMRAFAVLAVGLLCWYVVGSMVVAAAGVPPPVNDAVLAVLVVGLPVAIAYGVLRHHLYGIDFVVRRVAAWSLLSAGLLAAYLTVVAVVTAAAPHDGAAALVAALVVVLVLAPLNRLAQTAVDRLFYGRRGDPARVLRLAGFSLATAAASGEVPQRLADLITTTLRLPWACVELDREGGWEPVATSGRRDPSGPPTETIRVAAAGEEPARIVVQPRRGEQSLTRADRRLLEELATQVAPALLSVRLVDELERSRERLLAARHDERERVRRDLHDTLSPALNGIRLAVTAARRLLPHHPQEADGLLATVSTTADETTRSVQRMLRQLRPQALTDGQDVIAELTRRVEQVACAAGMAVEVRADLRDPLPPATADAVYRIAVEAVTNAARHAHATHCTVRIVAADEVSLEVCDDGHGLPKPIRPGVGLESMSVRAVEVGGRCDIGDHAGGGTRVHAVLPKGGTA